MVEDSRATTDQKARIKGLLKDERILGRLAPIVQRTSLVIERGFVRRCKLNEAPRARDLEAAKGYPPLAAISQIEGRLEHLKELAPDLSGVRTMAITNRNSPLDGVERSLLGAMGDFSRVEVLACNLRAARVSDLAAIATSIGPLVELRLQDEGRPDENSALVSCLGEAWSSRLRQLEVLGDKAILSSLGAILELAMPTDLLEVRLRGRRLNEPLLLERSKRSPFLVTATRDTTTGSFDRVTIAYSATVTFKPAQNPRDTETMLEAIEGLGTAKPRQLHLRGQNRRFVSEPTAQRLREAALAVCENAVVEL